MAEEHTVRLYQEIHRLYGESDDIERIPAFLADVNKRLQPLSMEIKRGVDENELDSAVYYALVNLHQDEQSKLATEFDAREVGFFKKVIDLIVTSEDGTVSSTDLLNAGNLLDQPIHASAAKNLLEQFVRSLWISENRSEGSYFLGPRSHIELLPHLRGAYGDAVVDCKLCSNTVIRGQRCPACDTKIHLKCAARYFGGRDEPQCPTCRAAWTHEIPEAQARHTAHRQRERTTAAVGTATMGSSQRSSGRRAPRRHSSDRGTNRH